jgi:hypothetical protein
MRANNRPTKTTEPHPDPKKRGVMAGPMLRFAMGAPRYKIATEFNKRCIAERLDTLEEFAQRSHAARQAGNARKALYWRRRANRVSG